MIDIKIIDLGSSAAVSVEVGRIAKLVKQPSALMKVLGTRGANELKTHFRMRNNTPNKLGGTRTNFWNGVAGSVQRPTLIDSNTVRISITHPAFAQKVFGGTITPKRAGALTIPVDSEAYGKTVAQFQHDTGIQLFLLRKKGGGMSSLLAGIVSEGKVKVFYVLRKSVTQAKDPAALPPEGKFDGAIIDEARSYLDRETRRGK